jgi:hypothetical protein
MQDTEDNAGKWWRYFVSTLRLAVAVTHPDYASLVDPLFRKRERGLFHLESTAGILLPYHR